MTEELYFEHHRVPSPKRIDADSINLNEPSCGGNDGSLQVQAGGIVAPHQFTLYKELNGSFVHQETGTFIAGNLSAKQPDLR